MHLNVRLCIFNKYASFIIIWDTEIWRVTTFMQIRGEEYSLGMCILYIYICSCGDLFTNLTKFEYDYSRPTLYIV